MPLLTAVYIAVPVPVLFIGAAVAVAAVYAVVGQI